ncbi:MAG TPA: right-handed parallel beta-helix repeat-containing protein [Tepidisphaeraceae bacterium]|jgi:parallel beta-helix repeat protein
MFKSSICRFDSLEIRRLLSTIYVSSAAIGADNGSSWSDAFTDLQAALTNATSGTTIEVGQGTYYPTSGTDRTATFALIDGVSIEGGFAGTGTANPDARDVSLYPSILSGDIGTQGDASDNSYVVVTGNNVDSTAVLDGFTVSGATQSGMANSYGNPTINNTTFTNNSGSYGAGIDNQHSSPTLTNCTITGNTASDAGGGMYNYYSSPVLNKCTISGNNADQGGGGIYNDYSSPTLTQCTISGNTTTQDGGGVDSNGGSPSLTGCIIEGNSAGYGGGINNEYGDSKATLANCVIVGNTATGSGGGVADNADAILLNCTITGNTAGSAGGGVATGYTTYYATKLTNCIVWGNSAPTANGVYNAGSGENPVITFSDVEDGAKGNGNVNADPQFVRDPGTNGANDYGDLDLQSSSPGRNAGSTSAVSGIATDIVGNPRVSGGKVDMGAYEYASNSGSGGSGGGTSGGTASGQLVFSTQPAGTTAGSKLGTVTIEDVDSNGNVLSSAKGKVTLSLSGAKLLGGATAVLKNGVAVFSHLTIDQAGTYTLSANGGSLGSVASTTFAITPAAVSKIAFASQPANVAAGTAFNVEVTLTDRYGNLAGDGDTVQLSLGAHAGQAVLNQTATGSGGEADFDQLTLDAPGNYTLIVKDGKSQAVSKKFVVS